ncbi:hypothetical protein ACC709_36855, partial [Rhizobium ruizarguesonis]
ENLVDLVERGMQARDRKVAREHGARRTETLEAMLYPWQMSEALELARAFPQTLFVINHGGSQADRTEDGMALWRRGLRALGN